MEMRLHLTSVVVPRIALPLKTRCRARQRLRSQRVSACPRMSRDSEATPSSASTAKAMEEFYDGFKGKIAVRDMRARELKALLDEGQAPVVVVDVRTEEERRISRLPGDRVVTRSQFEADPQRYKDHLVVPYCTIGYRSGKYAENLQKEGFEVANLACSILGWVHEGYPIVSGEKPDQESKEIHTFLPRFAWVPEGYTAVTFSAPQAIVAGARSLLPSWLGGRK